MGRPKGSTKFDHDRILYLHKSGVPSSAIARRTGCSRSMVNRVIREHYKKQKEETVVKV